MYRHGITSFASMSNVNKSFRVYLEENCIIQTLRVENSIPSQKEASVKILFRTDDDQFIETVSMVDGNRHTVCISSQVGCALDCSFCATGQMGLERNLSTGEIIDQLIFVRENIKQPITNVVFMGMGEPFHNYENVLNAADIFHSPKGFNLASTRITISTVGLLPQIKQFIKEKRRFKLAISLNAADDGVRSSIMPVNKKWSIADLIETGKEYSNQKKRLVMFEYVLLKGINDSEDDALNLAQLLKGVSCKINLIPYNETNGMYRRPDEAVISRFSEILHKNRDEYRVLVRWSKGQDIKAGCGQLAGQKT
jgi:23S rRNA (adenine2503-C2)-methyltransferase